MAQKTKAELDKLLKKEKAGSAKLSARIKKLTGENERLKKMLADFDKSAQKTIEKMSQQLTDANKRAERVLERFEVVKAEIANKPAPKVIHVKEKVKAVEVPAMVNKDRVYGAIDTLVEVKPELKNWFDSLKCYLEMKL